MDPRPQPTALKASSAEETDASAGAKEDRHFVTALARGLDLLTCFKRGEGTLANSEIAARCGLARSTVSRLSYTLTRLGYLHHVPEAGGYRLGTALMALGATRSQGSMSAISPGRACANSRLRQRHGRARRP
jgi:hypothetical protein